MQQRSALLALVALCAVYAPHVRAAPAQQQSSVVGTPAKQDSLAQCVVDIGISSIWLGKAGLELNSAVKTCTKRPAWDKPTTMESASCSASVTGLISGFMYSTSFAAAAAAECQKSMVVLSNDSINEAMCTSDLTKLAGSLALIAQSGSAIYQVCSPPGGHPKRLENHPEMILSDDTARRLDDNSEGDSSEVHPEVQKRISEFMDGDSLNETKVALTLELVSQKLQRVIPDAPVFSAKDRRLKGIFDILSPGPKIHPKGQVRKADEAECAFDVGQATFFLARAGLMINAAVKDCSSSHLYEGANRARAVCSVDVSSMIGAFSFVASGISYSVFHCPAWKRGTKAACAGAIINMVAALAEVAAAASDFENSCSPPPPTFSKKQFTEDLAGSGVV